MDSFYYSQKGDEIFFSPPLEIFVLSFNQRLMELSFLFP